MTEQALVVRVIPGGDVLVPATVYERMGRPSHVGLEFPTGDRYLVIRNASVGLSGRAYKVQPGPMSSHAPYQRVGSGGRIYKAGRRTNTRRDLPCMTTDDGILIVNLHALPKVGAS